MNRKNKYGKIFYWYWKREGVQNRREEKAGCWRGELMLIEKGKGRERKTKWKKERSTKEKWKRRSLILWDRLPTLHTHTPHFLSDNNLWNFYCTLSGKKMSWVHQELLVSLLSLQRTAEPFAPGDLMVYSLVLEMLTFDCPNCQVTRKCGGMSCIGSILTGAGPPNIVTQHSCIL